MALREHRMGATLLTLCIWPLRSNGTVNNAEKAKWLVGLVDGFVTPPVIRSIVL